jgi:hypothetical protein
MLKKKFNNDFIKNYLLIVICTILIIILGYLLVYDKNKYIESFKNRELDVSIPNLINGNTITIYKEPDVKLIEGNKISGNILDKKRLVFPSIFYFPYKNYIGRFYFYKFTNNTEVPDFILNNVRLIVTNFNTPNNYLLYVSLKVINENPKIYDLAVMDFNKGTMRYINSKEDLKNSYFTLDRNNYFIFDNKKLFNVYPIEEGLELTGTIESNQEDLLMIKVLKEENIELKNESYYIIFEQYVDIQLNNFRNTIKNNNFGLYKNLNILV